MKNDLCRDLTCKLLSRLFIVTLVCMVVSTPVCAEEKTVAGTESREPCSLSPISVPKFPDSIPGYTELDPDTGLHVTGTYQVIDLETYVLEIAGRVEQPRALKYDELRCLPRTESRAPLICPGFFEDNATWSGASLKHVLEQAGVREGATHIRMVSADGYAALVEIKEALSGSSFLAYEWEDEPLPILHGFPVRAVFPGLNGNKWVKWLVRIEVQ
ncbi:MAG: molybdopterin-dependent oxidoreductase [Desulfocapsaceae bacterium]|jgi:DMSO/TMAO reductase YedYZ molybdopterin-dependent catalytic subunit|nr:molybdopterin-dependent oxidoreductase [Desulfocapsaceae bacterium]